MENLACLDYKINGTSKSWVWKVCESQMASRKVVTVEPIYYRYSITPAIVEVDDLNAMFGVGSTNTNINVFFYGKVKLRPCDFGLGGAITIVMHPPDFDYGIGDAGATFNHSLTYNSAANENNNQDSDFSSFFKRFESIANTSKDSFDLIFEGFMITVR